MATGVDLLAPLNPLFFALGIGSLLLAHFAASLLSWGGSISLLRQSYPSDYSGSTATFFGGDETVAVYLLGQVLAMGVVL